MKECDGCRIKHQKIMELNEQITVQKGMLMDFQKERKEWLDIMEKRDKEIAELNSRLNVDWANSMIKECEQARLQGREECIAEIADMEFCPSCFKVMGTTSHYCEKCEDRVSVPFQIDKEDLIASMKKGIK